MKRFLFSVSMIMGFLGIMGWIHAVWHIAFFSLLPVYVVIPTVIAWVNPKPFWWIIIFSQIAEIFTTFPPGVMTVVVLIPYGISVIVRSSIDIDLSFRFGSILLLSTFLQEVVLTSFALGIIFYPSVPSLLSSVSHIPWHIIGTMIGMSTLAVFITCIVWREVIVRPL